jgi:hypothetical protein
MQVGRIADIIGMIVVVAGITVVVSSKNTAADIKAFGSAFSGSLSAAMGK